MSLLIVFSTYWEAEESIRQLDAIRIDDNTFQFSHGLIVISGIGILPSILTVSKFAQFKEVWNVGICGCLTDNFKIGEFFKIGCVGKFNYLPKDIDQKSEQLSHSLFPTLCLASKGYKLLSIDFPLHHSPLRKELGKNWDFIDMEGYGIALAAQFFGKKCSLFKLISDFASDNGRYLISQNKNSLAKQLAEHIKKQIYESSIY